MPIGAHHLLTISGNDVRGRLGILLVDGSNGDIISLTAAQVARGAEFVEADGRQVGNCSPDRDRSFDGQPERPAWTMIEKIRVRRDVRLAPAAIHLGGNRTSPGFQLCLQPDDIAGQAVLIHVEGGPLRGWLRAVRGYFEMPAPDRGEHVLFTHTLEIAPAEGDRPACEGEAGAVVTTDDGAAFGIVFGGDGRTSFAAPIGGVLIGNEDWRPVMQADIDSWNGHLAQRTGVSLRTTKHRWTGLPLPPMMDAVRTQGLVERAAADDPETIEEVGRELADAF